MPNAHLFYCELQIHIPKFPMHSKRYMVFKTKCCVDTFQKALTTVFFIHFVRTVREPITDQRGLQTLLIGWTFPKISFFTSWRHKERLFALPTVMNLVKWLKYCNTKMCFASLEFCSYTLDNVILKTENKIISITI